jgi:acetyl-CoA C-acetyltransferase
MQSLAQLQPAFGQLGEMAGFDAVAIQAHPEVEAIDHVHHAGNSSGIVDGAAAVLIGNKKAGRKAGLQPRARIRAFANIGSEPAMMLTGPVDVTHKLLKRARMSRAIAMGHPLGATGAMILGTAIDELERRDLNTALITLCIGAGMGTATIIERV